MKTTIGAGLSQAINQQGGRFYYVGGRGAIEVKLQSGGDTRRFELLPGKGVSMRPGERFDGLEIVNLHGTDQEIEFEVSDREVFDNRVTGTVEIINAGKNRTLDNQAFFGGRRMTPPAGEYAFVMLENPVGSGKTLYVNRSSWSVVAAANVALGQVFDVATLLAGAGVTPAGSEAAVNKKIGGIDSVGRVHSGNSTGTGLPSYAPVFSYEEGAKVKTDFLFTEPVMLEEGRGIIVFTRTTDVQMTASFELFEEAK